MLYFRHATDVETHPAGTTLLSQGAPGDRMYVVQEGEIEIQVDGRVVEKVGRDGFFGEMALIDHSPRSASAVAVTEVRVVPIDERRFLRLVQETPGFALSVLRVMAERLRRMDHK